MPSHDFDKAQFDRSANDKDTWRMRGTDLHMSSKVLREKFTSLSADFDPENNLAASFNVLLHAGLPTQAAMLQGFSVEVLLKAYWLHQGNKLAEDGEYALPGLKKDNHDLCAIAEVVGFDLSDAEKEVLGRLSLITSSYGRYPVTKKWHQNPMKENEHGVPTRFSWNDQDHDLVESVIKRLDDGTK